MSSAPATDVTGLLRAWSGGDREARERILTLVYPELRKIAQRCLSKEHPGHTLQATALVNELYLRLIRQRNFQVTDRRHFYTLAAMMMRRMSRAPMAKK